MHRCRRWCSWHSLFCSISRSIPSLPMRLIILSHCSHRNPDVQKIFIYSFILLARNYLHQTSILATQIKLTNWRANIDPSSLGKLPLLVLIESLILLCTNHTTRLWKTGEASNNWGKIMCVRSWKVMHWENDFHTDRN